LDHRFFKYPIFKYRVYGLFRDEKCGAIMVTRTQECNGNTALRIIDYMGDQSLFSGLGAFFDNQLLDHEYVDFYCYGFDGRYLESAGFIERMEDDSNIIPNYFYPLVQKNIEIYCTVASKETLVFKGDGDQDRPN
jgi:hypothetical protein